MSKPLLSPTVFSPIIQSIGVCVSILGLSALPSHGETIVPINLNNPTSTHWIKLQQEGRKSDRQLVFAQMDHILPVIEDPSSSQLRKPSPPIVQPKAVQPHIWLVRLITVNESTNQPGYIDAHAEINCQQPQMRVIQKIAVPYSAIQSPEAEVLEAYKKKLQLVQRRSPKISPIAFQSKKSEPWQPIANTSPVFKFACDQTSWRSALKSNDNGPASVPGYINTTALENRGFAFVGAFSVPAQDLFADAWNKVWTDGERPAQWSQPRPADARPVLKPPLPEYLETIAKANGITSRAVGVAAVKPPLYEAFEQALEAGSALRPEIDWLISEGTPAGRIHGAVLLLHVDPKAGRQALEQMRSDQTMLWESNGCSIQEKSVSTIVNEILQCQSVFPCRNNQPL
jgi:hypothetical protein